MSFDKVDPRSKVSSVSKTTIVAGSKEYEESHVECIHTSHNCFILNYFCIDVIFVGLRIPLIRNSASTCADMSEDRTYLSRNLTAIMPCLTDRIQAKFKREDSRTIQPLSRTRAMYTLKSGQSFM